jgi:dTDP-4-amino-4,6-dideoxygalactose transaminase
MIRTRQVDFENGFLRCFSFNTSVLPSQGLLLSRGRDALAIICRELKRQYLRPVVLVPAFICGIVPETFVRHGVGVSFYDVTDTLEIDFKGCSNCLAKNKDIVALLYVNYFGFLQPKDVIERLVEFGIRLIEDNTQGFLSGSILASGSASAGWIFNSYRKLLPVPDGALLSLVGGQENMGNGLNCSSWIHIVSHLSGLLFKGFALNCPEHYLESITQECFTLSVRTMEYQAPAGIANISKFLLKHQDIAKVIAQRRRNYHALLDNLDKNNRWRLIFEDLPGNICPFGLPVYVRDRAFFQERLLQNRISAAILWDRNKRVSPSEYRGAMNLSDHILVLPVGQAYSEEDMMRIAHTVNELI